MIRLFRIGGIPIRLDAGWFFVFGLIVWSLASGYFPYVLPGGSDGAYWAGGVVAALLLFTSVLLHELSHALVARAHGVGVAAITLHVFGGVSELETEPPDPQPARARHRRVGHDAVGGRRVVAGRRRRCPQRRARRARARQPAGRRRRHARRISAPRRCRPRAAARFRSPR